MAGPSLLDLYDHDAAATAQGLRPVDPTPPAPTISQLFDAGRETQRPRNTNFKKQSLYDAYAPMLDAINVDRAKRGLRPLRNPGVWDTREFSLMPSEDYGFGNMRELGARHIGLDEQEATIFNELRAIRQRNPAFLKNMPGDVASFNDERLKRETAQYRHGEGAAARGSGIIDFLATTAGSIYESGNDPLTWAALPLGGAGKTALGSVAREALVNGAVEGATAMTVTGDNLADVGEDYTVSQGAADVALAMTTGALFEGAMQVGRKAAPRAGQAVGKAIDFVAPGYREGRAMLRETERLTLDASPDAAVVEAFRARVPEDLRTDDERAALHVIERDTEIRATNPYADTPAGMNAHADRLQMALDAVTNGRPVKSVLSDAADRGTPLAIMRPPVPRGKASVDRGIVKFFEDKGYSPAQARGIAAGIEAESRSDHTIRGGYKGRALGLGQWLGPRREAIIREYGPNPTREQQLEFLHRELQGGDAGGAAVRAATTEEGALNAYIRDFMRPAKGAQTDGDLQRGMAALGRERDPLPGADAVAPDGEFVARNPDLDAPRPEMVARESDIEMPDPPPLRRELFASDADYAAAQAAHDAEWRGEAIAPVRAAAMDGSKAATVTASLIDEAEVKALLPQMRELIAKGEALRVPSLAKSLDADPALVRATLSVLADDKASGLQRMANGIVRRRPPAGAQQPLDLLSFIARNGGIQRPRKGDGSVNGWASLRDASVGRHDLIKGRGFPQFAPGGGHLFRKGGMTIDEIDEIGEMLSEAGFFPGRDRVSEADVLDTLERAVRGEKIYAARDQADAEALALAARNRDDATAALDAYMNQRGYNNIPADAEARMLDKMLYEGHSPAEAVEAVAHEDLADALALSHDLTDDRIYEFDPEQAGRAGQGDAGPTDQAGDPGPSENDVRLDDQGALSDYREELSPTLPDAAALAAFDAPDGSGAKAIADSLEHDARAQLRADSPLRGGNVTGKEQDGTMGLGLFDAADEPTFDLGDGRMLTERQLLDEIDADQAAIKAAKDCL